MSYSELLSGSKKELNLADHISRVTFPMIKDQRVFLNILSHINEGIMMAVKAYLLKQQELKNLRIAPSSEELILRLFFESYAKKLNINNEYIKAIKEIRHVISSHKKSRMELKRGEEYVMIMPDFKTLTINETEVKRYLSTAQNLINRIEGGIEFETNGTGETKIGSRY